MQERILAENLKIGMYVSQLDRPWLETNFLFQGFLIRKEEEIEEIQKQCDYVYVDVSKSHTLPKSIISTPVKKIKNKLYNLDSKSSDRLTLTANEIKIDNLHRKHIYEKTSKIEDEAIIAIGVYQDSQQLMQEIIHDIQANNPLNFNAINKTTEKIIASIIRNPDALFWLAQLKNLDTYTYKHAINVSTYMIGFGRHLGLDENELLALGQIGLLQDIGKIKIPQELLTKKTEITTAEQLLFQSHVRHTIDILKLNPEVPPYVFSTIHSHHERYRGQGYPQGLKQNEITIFSSIAGIIDSYDAITSQRPFAKARSSYSALREFLQKREIDFSKDLTELFVEFIGIYAAGSIVQLNTNEIGVVLEQNRQHRLKPRVLLIYDSEEKLYAKLKTVDLSTNPMSRMGTPYQITKVIEPNFYDIDINNIFNLLTQRKS